MQHLAGDGRQQGRAEIVAVIPERLRERGGRIAKTGRRLGRYRHIRRQQQRFAQQQAEVFGEHRVAAAPQRGEIPDAGLVLRMHAPQVGREFRAQFAVIGQQLRCVEAGARFQRVFAQHPRAEAVDGEHRGEVDVQRRLPQPALQRVIAFDAACALRIQQFTCEFRGCALVVGFRRVEQVQCELQAFADALAQFLRRRLGKGDREDLADAQPALDDEAHDQRRQGEGLAGTGAGLDQLHAGQRHVEEGIARGTHAASSDSMSGARASPISIGAGSP